MQRNKKLSAHVVLMGDQNSGKSQLIKYYYEHVTPQPEFNSFEATYNEEDRTLIMSNKNKKSAESIFETWSPSQEITDNPFKEADVIILAFDLTNENAIDELNAWLKLIKSAYQPLPPILLVGTKLDLLTLTSYAIAMRSAVDAFVKDHSEEIISYFETSTITGVGVKNVFECALDFTPLMLQLKEAGEKQEQLSEELLKIQERNKQNHQSTPPEEKKPHDENTMQHASSEFKILNSQEWDSLTPEEKLNYFEQLNELLMVHNEEAEKAFATYSLEEDESVLSKKFSAYKHGLALPQTLRLVENSKGQTLKPEEPSKKQYDSASKNDEALDTKTTLDISQQQIADEIINKQENYWHSRINKKTDSRTLTTYFFRNEELTRYKVLLSQAACEILREASKDGTIADWNVASFKAFNNRINRLNKTIEEIAKNSKNSSFYNQIINPEYRQQTREQIKALLLIPFNTGDDLSQIARPAGFAGELLDKVKKHSRTTPKKDRVPEDKNFGKNYRSWFFGLQLTSSGLGKKIKETKRYLARIEKGKK